MATAGGTKLSREEWKKKQELEAARKAGTVAPEVDEEGNMINPHIPQYISEAPWYLNQDKPSLKHQKLENNRKEFMDMENNWYKRGQVKAKAATKYRKGACDNCGAMTHSKRDCTERPRKTGAKWSGKNIAPDEIVSRVDFTWDGKRDRWNGYEADDHREVVEEYEKVEEMKNKIKEKRLESEYTKPGESSQGALDAEGEEEFKYTEGAEVAGQKFDSKARMTVRNLRIREDTAKYLRNLDGNSAYYDPKTHAMRDNPYGSEADPTSSTYAGDNFVRHTGDTVEFAKTQMFAWEAGRKGTDLNLLAEPTAVELHRKQVVKKKEAIEQSEKQAVLEKYGGEEYILKAPPKELLLSQTEHYVEYDPRSGKVTKGIEKGTVRSKYEEDVYPGNHSSVWGSFWSDGQWGYACCCALVRGAYCVGSEGKIQYKQALEKKKKDEAALAKESESTTDTRGKSLAEQHKERLAKKEKMDAALSNAARKGKNATADEKALLAEAKAKEKEREKRINELMRKELKRREDTDKAEIELDDRKRPYNSLREDLNYQDPTEEEMEAHKRLRMNYEDPMKDFMGKN